MKKNDIIHLTIEDISTNGEGIGKYNGMPFFVPQAVIGDKIIAGITKLKKHYGFARLISIEEPSLDRVTPRCTVAAKCGGCSLMQMSYEKQLVWKERVCDNALLRIGGIAHEALMKAKEPIVGMEEPYHFRNKSQYPVGRDRDGHVVIGFYAMRSHRIIPLVSEVDLENDSVPSQGKKRVNKKNKEVKTWEIAHDTCSEAAGCRIAQKDDRNILLMILRYILKNHVSVYDEISGRGLIRHILIRHGLSTGEVMVCLVLNGKHLPFQEELIAALRDRFGICSLVINVNTRRDNVILGDHTYVLWGRSMIRDSLLGRTFFISAKSFYQVNPVQTEKLYRKAMEYAGLTGHESVWDLYCGIGTISLCMAEAAGRVIGIEVVPEAVRDAEENAVQNGITNVEFIQGKAENLLYEVLFTYGKPDVVIVDPPRKGLDEEAIRVILKAAPERLIYVSCNPATLARDIKLLDGYVLEKYTAFDQFCHSGHVETCVLLVRESISDDDMVSIKVDLNGISLDQGRYVPPAKPAYKNIKQWIFDKYGFNVSTLYIAQIKDKVGLEKRKNYNPGSGEGKVLVCPPEKEKAIMDAFRHFNLI